MDKVVTLDGIADGASLAVGGFGLCGIPAFYAPAGVPRSPTEGLPWRYNADGSVAVASPRREVREFQGPHVCPRRGRRHRLRTCRQVGEVCEEVLIASGLTHLC
ncbi:hypothetical protein JOF56_010808 [Kibdelosporangium banguiense]|uniref:Uncharacterized protein n=1 Tax=Kibdelosporangium banguiense TaxID=1365924 RepID=A0ABS4U198_9PSEU|nr:hypothetical protein [Kibdelosporangium banguiense]